MKSKNRFNFGRNWLLFLSFLNEERIVQAEKSLQQMLNINRLDNKTFIDVGSGSGIFSLAARRLGAKVHSFDYDEGSVSCTNKLKRSYFPDDNLWVVERESILNKDYLFSLDKFDVVYSWGVLHHTGKMWEALENAIELVKPGGFLFISIYNDQGKTSKYWKQIKRTYNYSNRFIKRILLGICFVRLWGPTMFKDLVRGKPFKTWNTYFRNRGMSPWRDVVDWVGGYPFEVARSEEIISFYRKKKFILINLKTCGTGHGCNEFVFQRA